MRLQRKTLLAGAIVLALGTTIGTAIAGYTTGETFTKASGSYKLGYAAGAIDMLTALQEQGLLKEGSFNDQTAKIAQCLKDKKVKQSHIASAYLAFLKENPKRQGEAAAPNISTATVAACASIK
jgi:hypothetical protein